MTSTTASPGSGTRARRPADPTAVERIRLACAQIVEAWPHLDAARDSTLARSATGGRTLTARAALTLDDTIRAERGGRLFNERHGYVPLPAAAAPVNVHVVDAERAATETLRDLAWLAASHLANQKWGWPPLHQAIPGDPCAFLTCAAPHLGGTARPVATELAATASRLFRAVGLDEQWRQTGRRCPACRRRTLLRYANTVTCSGHAPRCLCDGDGCPCGRSGAVEGSEHLWPAGVVL